MDKSTLIGLALGIFFLLFGIGISSVFIFINPSSLLITYGGTFGSLFIAYSMEQVLNTGKVMKNAFTTKADDPLEIISHIVKFSEKARREGLLAMEKELASIEHIPFLVKGLQLVIDGSDLEIVRTVLTTERSYIEDRHRVGAGIFDALAAYAPAWGMIGTIIGLILMLRSLDDPGAVGPAMAVALLTTLYGAIGAFFIFTPVANKLKVRSAQEIMLKDIMIGGIVAIQSGDNPRMVKEKLVSYVSPNDKSTLDNEEDE